MRSTVQKLSEKTDIELVIAHYNENLDWLGPFSTCSTVYSKGSTAKGEYRHVQTLPNIGREAHTFLYHIVNRYNTLARRTIFLQGNIHDAKPPTLPHTQLSVSEIVATVQENTDRAVLPLSDIYDFRHWNGLYYPDEWLKLRGETLVRSRFTPGEFWELIFGTSHPVAINFIGGALFATSDETIKKRPKSFYAKILQVFEDVNAVDPEEGHYMERFWFPILSNEAITEL